jgi:hypothetical protein
LWLRGGEEETGSEALPLREGAQERGSGGAYVRVAEPGATGHARARSGPRRERVVCVAGGAASVPAPGRLSTAIADFAMLASPFAFGCIG